MASEEQVGLLRQGADVWNRWRIARPTIQPDLSGANLPKAELRMVHLRDADLHGADLELALFAGATFVARGFSGEQKHLTELIKQAIQHKGFAFIDVFSPCVTYNLDNTYTWFKQRVKKLEDDPSYDSTNWTAAMGKSQIWAKRFQ